MIKIVVAIGAHSLWVFFFSNAFMMWIKLCCVFVQFVIVGEEHTYKTSSTHSGMVICSLFYACICVVPVRSIHVVMTMTLMMMMMLMIS